MENNLNNRMNEKVLPIVAAVVGHSIWGFSYLFTRMALSVTSPDVLLTVRFSIAFLILNILILTGKFKLSLKGKSAGLLAAFSIMEPIYFYCESYGILYTNVTYSGVVLSIVPIVAMLFAAIFIKEYPAKRQLVFCILPIAGVIMITLSGSELGIIKPIGILLLAFTLFASAGYRTLNRKLAEKYKGAILIKGGHLVNDATDLLYQDGKLQWFRGKRVANPNTHGTGCTLSSAIACNLALGFSVEDSVANAKAYLTGALEAMLDLGAGSGPLNHVYAL